MVARVPPIVKSVFDSVVPNLILPLTLLINKSPDAPAFRAIFASPVILLSARRINSALDPGVPIVVVVPATSKSPFT